MACKHAFESCKIADYEFCNKCGTYHSKVTTDLKALYGSTYWSEQHGSIWEQVWNVDMHTEGGVSKNRFVLDRIESARGAALEIGCAPGRMLYWLKWAARFAAVVGIEPAASDEVRRIGCFDGHLLSGMFPEVMVDWQPSFDYVLGMDVFEHSPEPEAFMAECYRLLNPGGQLMLMLPLSSTTSGFLPDDSRFFNPIEHIYLHSSRHMNMLLEDAGFTDVKHDRWTLGHDTVSARRL